MPKCPMCKKDNCEVYEAILRKHGLGTPKRIDEIKDRIEGGNKYGTTKDFM